MSVAFIHPTPAKADWRWPKPHFKIKKFKPVCDSTQCHIVAHIRTQQTYKARIKYYNAKKLAEWNQWIHLYIPKCTWYGESGTGPEYARTRYTVLNMQESGARGKFQFMPGTYQSVAKYNDWSPLDQEIAVRLEYWLHGTTPWSAC